MGEGWDLNARVGDEVASHNGQWIYPEPIPDLEAHRAPTIVDEVEPRRHHLLYWPDGAYLNRYHKKLKILVVGGGANAAALYALRHPGSTVTGVDICETALAHAATLKKKHRLLNLRLHHLPAEEVASLGETFDFIDATGLARQFPEPLPGVLALKSTLHREGTMVMVLNGLYGRTGVYMLREFFYRLNFQPTMADLCEVRETLESLGSIHPAREFLDADKQARASDAAMVDLLLRPIDTPFNVEECLHLVRQGGLSFQGWLDNFYYYPDAQLPGTHPLSDVIRAMPTEECWRAMELFHGNIRRHAFYVCHPERPVSSHQFDFTGEAFLDFIPVRRTDSVTSADPVRGTSALMRREGFPPIPLNARQEKLFQHVDGINTIRQCLEKSGLTDPPESLIMSARNFFEGLWRIGFAYFQIPVRTTV